MKNKKHFGYIGWAAALAAVGAVFKLALAGYSFLAYGFFAAAAVLIALFALKYLGKKRPKAARTLTKIVYYCVFAFCIALAVTEFIIASDAKTDAVGEDYVIVLGAGVNGTTPSATLQWRLETALEYLNGHPDAVCVVSGGQGPGEDVTEAECMYGYLTAAGIDGARIIKEERSESTRENLIYSKEILDAESGGAPYTAAIVTSDFHLCRAKTMAYRMGLEASGVSAPTKLPVLKVNYCFREAFALWYMAVTKG